MTELDRLVSQVMTKRQAVIEEMCERSLTDPAGRGVLVVEHAVPSFPMDDVCAFRLPDFSIGLSAEVPYGQIHYQQERP